MIGLYTTRANNARVYQMLVKMHAHWLFDRVIDGVISCSNVAQLVEWYKLLSCAKHNTGRE